MIVAVDYHNTFTSDVPLWKAVIKAMRERGYKVICVSSMQDTDENRGDMNVLAKDVFDEVLLVGQEFSKLVAAKIRGYEVDIWIDDNPYAIV